MIKAMAILMADAGREAIEDALESMVSEINTSMVRMAGDLTRVEGERDFYKSQFEQATGWVDPRSAH